MRSNRSRLRAALGACLAAAVLAPPALAQKLATRDELRACMNAADDLQSRRDALQARSKRSKDEAAAIHAEEDELKERQKQFDDGASHIGRPAFERKVKEHNARIAAARTEAASFNADLEALQKAMAEHNERCSGIAYRPEDKAAILQERAAAGK